MCVKVDGNTVCLHEVLMSTPVDYEVLEWIDVTFETTVDSARSIDSFRIYIMDENDAPTVSSITLYDNNSIESYKIIESYKNILTSKDFSRGNLRLLNELHLWH